MKTGNSQPGAMSAINENQIVDSDANSSVRLFHAPLSLLRGWAQDDQNP